MSVLTDELEGSTSSSLESLWSSGVSVVADMKMLL